MNANQFPHSSSFVFLIFGLVMSCGTNLNADLDSTVIATSQDEIQTLQWAYSTLSVANHNYFGHRLAAMRQIRAAAGLLGVDLQGDGQGGENQRASDEQIAQVQQALEQLNSTLIGEEQKPVREHLDKAAKRLSMAIVDRAIAAGK